MMGQMTDSILNYRIVWVSFEMEWRHAIAHYFGVYDLTQEKDGESWFTKTVIQKLYRRLFCDSI
jgi:hypothetical protein